ncbi:MAG: hypothetical protein RH860_00825 [Cytophagales bacterium]
MAVILKLTLKLTRSLFLIAALSALFINFCISQSLEEVNKTANRKVKNGMLVLGSWAIANIAYAPIAAANSNGETKYFHQMNGYWNLINLGLSGAGFISSLKYDASARNLKNSIKEHSRLEKTLLFNAGLDLGYIAGGFYLRERALNANQRKDMLEGFGKSIVLQGAFLFVFDLSFYLYLKGHDRLYSNLISNIEIHPNGLGFKYRF